MQQQDSLQIGATKLGTQVSFFLKYACTFLIQFLVEFQSRKSLETYALKKT